MGVGRVARFRGVGWEILFDPTIRESSMSDLTSLSPFTLPPVVSTAFLVFTPVPDWRPVASWARSAFPHVFEPVVPVATLPAVGLGAYSCADSADLPDAASYGLNVRGSTT